MENKWIKITENLPKDMDVYLWGPRLDYPVPGIISNGKVYFWGQAKNVTHYIERTLPEMPKEAGNTEKEVGIELIRIYMAIGIDVPSNHDDIVKIVSTDVEASTGPATFTSEDVKIAFRRLLEEYVY